MQFYHCEGRLDLPAANVCLPSFPCQEAGHPLLLGPPSRALKRIECSVFKALRIPRVTPQQNGAEIGVPESAAAPPAF
jgi:hypothetical protein